MFDTEQFKKAVLNKAIRGELTSRLPEDGSAEDLIKEIDDEKKHLIEDGKIKKQKALPDIEHDEIPFDIPSNWKWVRLGNIGSWKSGSTPKRDHPEYYIGNVPWLKTGDLNNGIIKNTSETITELGLKKSNLRLNPIGSILIAMYGATIGKLGILDVEATTNQACCACIPYKGILNKYLFYFLMSQKNSLISLGAGGAQPNISRNKLINYTFPLPPLAEQQRILESIENCFEFAEYIEKENEITKDFQVEMKKSLLQAAMKGELTNQLPEDGSAEDLIKEIDDEKKRLIEEGKIKKQKALPDIEDDEIPFEIPSNWKWVRFQSICDVKDGTHDSPSYIEEGVPLVTSKNIKNGKIDFSTCKFISKEDAEQINKRSKVGIGDILMPMIGTIGNPAICDNEQLFSIKNVALIKNNKFLLNTFVFNWISLFQETLKKNSSGAVQSFVSLTKLRQMLIPLPPLAEQHRIVEKLDQLFSKLDN